MRYSSWPRQTAVLGLMLGAAIGCGARTEADYIPSDQRARDALQTSLTAWVHGESHRKIAGDSVTIEAQDWEWQAGEKLDEFEILRSENLGAGPKCFAVKLTTRKAPEGKEVRYMILGINPLWVYREEDYDRLSGAGD